MKIFMLSYGGGHSNMMAPVYKELACNDSYDITYVALTGAPIQLKNTGVEYLTISQVAKLLPYYEDIKTLGQQYGVPFHNHLLGIHIDDTIAYYGIGMHDLISKYGLEEAEKCFEYQNRKAFLPVESLKSMLKIFNPDVCVITASPRMEMAAGIAANEINIPVVRINDVPVCDPIPYNCSLCVMNNWAKDYAVDVAGISEESIYITGQPAFEADFSVNQVDVDNVKARLGVSRFSKVITFFTENGTDQSDVLTILNDIAREMEDVLFIIKLHPNQPIETYRDPGMENVMISNLDAKMFFYFSDIAITTFSTTGMEAALFGIPVIIVDFESRITSIYLKMGIAVKSENKEDLSYYINSLLDKESKEYVTLKNSQGKFEYIRNAACNICDVIANAANK